MKKNDRFLYLRLADKIETMIHQGVYAIGDKLPSVRSLHKEHGISISTALQVYTHLEKRGWVTAREKSGYFVQYAQPIRPQLPPVTNPSPMAAEVRIYDQVEMFLQKQKGKKFISLIGESPHISLLPTLKLNKALQQIARSHTTAYLPYGDLIGHEPLRRHIARLSLHWGGALHPEQIVVTNGAIEGAGLALRAVAKAGDTIAIESPTFFGLLQAIESLGMKALEIPTDPATGVSLDKLEHAFRKKKVQACLFTTNYNNPLGSCMPDSHKAQLALLLQQYQIPLIEDDVYGDLHFAPERPKTIKTYDRDGLVLYCSSFSKTIAPGLRIGWITGGRYHDKIARLKFMTSASTGLLPQLLITNFLEQQRMDLHLKTLRQTIHTQMMQVARIVQQCFPADTQLTRPGGGISSWVVLPSRVDTRLLHRQAMTHHFTFTPGGLFSSQDKYHHCLRLSGSNPVNEDQIWALQLLGKLIHQQLK
ncbi:aminotransferase-like domain-containing protein [Chitinophaga nivalis]|uniref:HTH-type transcriptional regulator NorG n=1 Tax=Chitinophaga nivalis TaxID=2991709 RepID=A0ABT3IPY0_9BACT|nr:PLP-dependent aminotransferase family protein [Chitinophaga nivalis]MCW3464449.1 PLP-dependent aminotransferase family protein [Chitinophaga nivalis]MCW3485860.1 PLP-dependent aminotransferase family protein [Chitinophaga nivalis]